MFSKLRTNVDLRHDFCAKLNDAQADPLADLLAERRAADEDLATDGPQPLPDCRCLPHHSDVAVTVDCGQGEMDVHSVASASENYSEEEALSEINGSESPPHLLAKMELYPSSLQELQMFRQAYRYESCSGFISFSQTKLQSHRFVSTSATDLECLVYFLHLRTCKTVWLDAMMA